MQIDASDIENIKKWIEDHWEGNPLCPVCKNNNWFIGRTISELRPFLKGKVAIHGLIFPAVLFSCNVCGHTLFFNAIKLGIIKLPHPKEGDGVATPPDEIAPPSKLPPPKEGDGVATPPKEKGGDDNG